MCTQAEAEDESDCQPMPKTRGECASVPRPCPHVMCKWNLQRKEIYRVGPGADVVVGLNILEQPPHRSCVLDVADAGGLGQADIAKALGVTTQRAQQIEKRAMAKVTASQLVNFMSEWDAVPCLDWKALYLTDMQYALDAAFGEGNRTQPTGGC